MVGIEEIISGSERILDGEFDNIPEQRLFMIGNIEEVQQHDAA